MVRNSDSLYDQNDYYASDGKGSRLSKVLNPLLSFFDNQKGRTAQSELHQTTGKILDIGAGDGKFLAYFKRKGFEVFGTTASSISQKAAKDLYDVELDFSTEVTGALANQKYDLVTHWHVFEHLEDPESHVKSVAQVLESHGKWIVEVPNIEGMGSQLCYDAWLGSDDVHHINHMKEKDFLALIHKHGFKVYKTQGFSLKFSYVFLWSALLGAIWGKKYSFDWIMELLKKPFAMVMKQPLLALNAIAAVFYFAPVILLLILWQVIIRSGEVKRYYIRRDLNDPR